MTGSTVKLKQIVIYEFIKNGLSYATAFTRRIVTNFKSNQERNWLVYFLRCSGRTLQEIGEQLQPPISREG